MEGLISLTRKTTPSNYTYICEKTGGSLSDKVSFPIPLNLSVGCFLKLILHCFSKVLTGLTLRLAQMDELACFAPGMLALGASGYGPEKAKQIMNLAEEVNPLGNFIFVLF